MIEVLKMIKKGLVVKLGKDYIIVMTNEGEYENIVLRERVTLGSKIMYTDKDVLINPTTTSYTTKYYRYAVAASIVLILLVSLFVRSAVLYQEQPPMEQTVATIIAVDINPSFQLMANPEDVIIQVRAMNKDAKTIDGESVIGLNIEEAIEQIVYLADEAHFINISDEDEDYILVTVVSAANGEAIIPEDEAIELDAETTQIKVAEIREKINSSAILNKVNFAVISATQKQLEEATQKAIPAGLYVAGVREEVTVKEYFSKEEKKEAFKTNGKVIDKEALKEALKEAKSTDNNASRSEEKPGQDKRQDKDKNQDKNKDKDKNQDKNKDKDQVQDQDKDKVQDQDKDKVQDQDKDKVQDQDKDKVQDQDKDQVQDQDKDKVQDQDKDQVQDQDKDQVQDQDKDQVQDQDKDKVQDQDKDQVQDQDKDQVQDQDKDQVQDQTQDEKNSGKQNNGNAKN